MPYSTTAARLAGYGTHTVAHNLAVVLPIPAGDSIPQRPPKIRCSLYAGEASRFCSLFALYLLQEGDFVGEDRAWGITLDNTEVGFGIPIINELSFERPVGPKCCVSGWGVNTFENLVVVGRLPRSPTISLLLHKVFGLFESFE